MTEFPKMMSGAKPKIKDGKMTFCYIDSFGNAMTDTKHILTPMEICQKVKDRMERFHLAGPGARESEISRVERKWISAHDKRTLMIAFDLLDGHAKMEMEMMLSKDSHYGISDPAWAKAHSKEREEIIGDNMNPL